MLFEYGPASIDQPLFKAAGLPKVLAEGDFSPNVLQRVIRGQAGVQRFFHDAGRTFCLYVVLGSFANRRQLVPAVNEVLATLTIDQLDATGEPTMGPTTTAPTTTAPPTTGAPTTGAPTTVAPTTTTPDTDGTTP